MLFIVLPAFNEGPALAKLLPEMFASLGDESYRILVVDDGSADNTATVAKAYTRQGVELIQHPQNRGLPEALRSGLLAALAVCQDSDTVITLDADYTHPAGLVPELTAKINQGFDLVVASRFAAGGREIGLPWYRRLLSRGAGWMIGSLFNLPGIRDYSCGFRAYRAGLLRQGFGCYGRGLIKSTGFAVAVELLLKLSSLAPKCAEVPLVLRYDLKCGKSKLPVLRTVAGYFGLIYQLKVKQKTDCQAEVEA